jgi:hypothetical protein
MSHRIVDYKIVKSDDTIHLEFAVKALLDKGYVPQGSLIAHFRSGLDDRFWQPMVKWEAAPLPEE